VPAIGFAVGLERILMVQEKSSKSQTVETAGPAVYVASLSPEEMSEGFSYAEALRRQGISTFVSVEARSLKKQFEQANKLGCRWLLLRGERERAQQQVALKEMSSGEQTLVPEKGFLEWIQQRLKTTPC
jgi:histidyl-tRNA synthetase